MTLLKDPSESKFKHLQERHYRAELNREIQDYMRNGDHVILSRILFKIYTHSPVPICLRQMKSRVLLALIAEQSNDFGITVD